MNNEHKPEGPPLIDIKEGDSLPNIFSKIGQFLFLLVTAISLACGLAWFQTRTEITAAQIEQKSKECTAKGLSTYVGEDMYQRPVSVFCNK